ncbi:30S ribosomal protein S8 [Candidatus Persebacteraceae bacterium Df01]|jgi:small subunit ribosomal protein S8|uniref:Small ribosomal subunit protein uS8 n=1 Tax=Candidatus Doriopsillibacter californiensis TaxID=2970740 RepID=A0ABT7QKS0_9GAMM|nr:30S ribosomal protein S8 [Candidatus Persebacteraceae bacterium Df01]
MMTDPIADMLARIKNAQAVGKLTVSFPNSRLKCAILDVLLTEGYIEGYSVSDDKRNIEMIIKYYASRPVIEKLRRASRPGLRRYVRAKDIELVQNGLGVAIISTSKGLMSDHQARSTGLGGEVLCDIC